MQPMITKVRELNDQLQGNRRNSEAGAGGADAKLAKKSRNLHLFFLHILTLSLPDRPRWL